MSGMSLRALEQALRCHGGWRAWERVQGAPRGWDHRCEYSQESWEGLGAGIKALGKAAAGVEESGKERFEAK